MEKVANILRDGYKKIIMPHNPGCTKTGLAPEGKRREKLESGSVSSFRKPRVVLTPQAPEPLVRQFSSDEYNA